MLEMLVLVQESTGGKESQRQVMESENKNNELESVNLRVRLCLGGINLCGQSCVTARVFRNDNKSKCDCQMH